MLRNKKNWIIDLGITIVVALMAYGLNSHSFFNIGPAWHIEAAKKILAGGGYLSNLFDTSTPVVFMFYLPVVLLHQLLDFSLLKLALFYISGVGLFSLGLSYVILRQAFGSNVFYQARLIYHLAVVGVFLLPSLIFGQREVIMIILLLPYFFAQIFSLKLDRPGFAILIGLMAATAVWENPFYLILFLTFDGYQWFRAGLFKPNLQQLTFYTGIVLWGGFIFSLYPNYITHIVPFIFCFESAYNVSYLALIKSQNALVLLLIALVMLLSPLKFWRKQPIMLTWLAALGSFVIFIAEKKYWYYHLYPAYFFVLILIGLWMAECLPAVKSSRRNYANKAIFGMVLGLTTLFTMSMSIAQNYQFFIQLFHNPQAHFNRWIKYAKQHFLHKKLMFFTTRLPPAYPLNLYASVKIVSPWANAWLVPALVNASVKQHPYCNAAQARHLLFQLTTQAIATQKPDYLIFDAREQQPYLNRKSFSYVKWLSQDPVFKQQFAGYRFYVLFQGYRIYVKRHS